MKKLLLACFLIQLFSVYLSAQTNPKCPAISVTGPSGYVPVGESAIFTANVSSETQIEKLEYSWTVSAGQITEGQGTPIIRVSIDRNIESNTIKATVELKGLPKDCISQASGVGEIIRVGHVSPIDEYNKLSSVREKERLGVLVHQLNQYQDQIGFIVLYASKKDTAQAFIARVNMIYNFLTRDNGIAKERVVLVFAGVEDNNSRTTVWVVPPDYDLEPVTTFSMAVLTERIKKELPLKRLPRRKS